MGHLACILLAAGQGTRMKSRIPKVLHRLAGRPMLLYPIEVARALGADPIVVVVGHKGQQVREAVEGPGVIFVTQQPQMGTGHAVKVAWEALSGFHGDILILSGDVPLLQEATLRRMVDTHLLKRPALTLLVGTLEDPRGYGRVLRDDLGRVEGVVEERDASSDQLLIKEVNAGTYCASPKALFEALHRLGRENAQGEYYLTDVVGLLSSQGVESVEAPCEEEFLGVNDREDLARAERIIQERIRRKWMAEGVTLRDPSSVYIHAGVKIGRDTVVEPMVFLCGDTEVGRDCWIGPGCWIEDSFVGNDVQVKPSSVIQGSTIEDGSAIGPFAHLRPGSRVEEGARIGNFVEVKEARIGKGSKAAHLSYLGDADIGQGVNVGAGTITCNYDGVDKHRTVIEDGAFIGSDTMLVAPVRVGKGASIGAGSTITKDVPDGALAIARAKQVNLRGKARLRKRK